MSKIIKILGTGCKKCKTTTELVQEVIKEKGIDAQVVKVEDMTEIMNYNVMTTPALVIDEEIKIKGRVPSKKELEELLINNQFTVANSEGSGCCCSGK